MTPNPEKCQATSSSKSSGFQKCIFSIRTHPPNKALCKNFKLQNTSGMLALVGPKPEPWLPPPLHQNSLHRTLCGSHFEAPGFGDPPSSAAKAAR